MNSKYIMKAGLFAVTSMIAQSTQAVDAVANPPAPTPAMAAVVKPLPPKLVAIASVAATPANQNAASNSVLYRKLDELRSENAILTESLKNAELRSKISTAGVNPTGQFNPTPGGTKGFPDSTFPGSSAPLSAQVQMVSGSGNNLTALISLSSGGSVPARVGSNIYGLGVVKSISLNEVVVASKNQTLSLPFANDSSSAPGGAGIPSGMPGMMPGGPR